MDFLKATLSLLVTVGFGCVPELDSDESTIDEARVIAIQAEPAEALPNTPVSYRALLVDSKGVRSSGELTWFYCNAPKPLAELGPINRACLDGAEDSLDRIGHGFTVQGTLPTAACSLFGPNPPPPIGDEPPGRPADPDQTGGFNLPVMLGVDVGQGQDILLYEQRIACGLPGVTPKLSIEFTQRYHRNENPRVEKVVVGRANGEQETLAEGDVLEVQAGEKLSLSVSWPVCPQADKCGDGVCGPDETSAQCAEDCTTPVGCGGQERYLWFDTQSRELSVRSESVRVAWYATGGTFENERTGVDEGEPDARTTNHWTAPAESSDLSLFTVLRDARGGVGFRELKVSVR